MELTFPKRGIKVLNRTYSFTHVRSKHRLQYERANGRLVHGSAGISADNGLLYKALDLDQKGQAASTNYSSKFTTPSLLSQAAFKHGKSFLQQTPYIFKVGKYAANRGSFNRVSTSVRWATSFTDPDLMHPAKPHLKVHAHDLGDLDKLIGNEQANTTRADLAENEQTGSVNAKSRRNRKYKGVAQFWSNYIPSNTPIEDRRLGLRNSIKKKSSRSNHVRNIFSDEESYFFGVLDGHGGGHNADVVAKRLGDYYMTTQVPKDEIKNYLLIASQQVSGKTFAPRLLPYRSRNLFNDKVTGDRTYPSSINVFNEIWPMWRDSLHKFAWDLAHGEIDVDTDAKAIAAAMHRLDEDILKEAWQYGSKDVSSVWGNLRSETREFFRNVGRTGCVGSVALIKQGVLTIGHLGDTRAILGRKTANGWEAHKISKEHNADDADEYKRILEEHPDEDIETVIIDGRVLGVLQPTRAFGDGRLKLHRRLLERMYKHNATYKCFPNYSSPPYVSNIPDVTTIPLSPDIKFLILGSDGFWEKFEPKFCGEAVFDASDRCPEERSARYRMTEQGIIEEIGRHIDSLEIIDAMDEEYERSRYKTHHGLENNVATNIIKNCLMVDQFGHSSKMNLIETLSLHPAERRMCRDDITVSIVKFG